jgi:predicted hydrocarbon binding protein
MSDQSTPKVVRCPEPFAPLFVEAEKIMEGFFADMERCPEKGHISISGVRYLLVRTESLSFELHEELRKSFGDAGARQIRYKLARALGIRDARMFHKRLGVTEPAMKLALGPVHFAHVGWAFVDIYPESRPVPDDSYFLAYSHPYSFEADAYIENGSRCKHAACFMNAGYSSGWCEVSFGLELAAEEITCRAMGHEQCVFVMAPPRKLQAFVQEYRQKLGVV